MNMYLARLKKLVLLLVLLAVFNEATLGALGVNVFSSRKIFVSLRLFDLLLVVAIFWLLFWHKISRFVTIGLYIVLGNVALIVFIGWGVGQLGYGFDWGGQLRHGNDNTYTFRPFPVPYDMFRATPHSTSNVTPEAEEKHIITNNALGFRGEFTDPELLDKNTLSLAFFGGSTGYNGFPTIPEMIGENLKQRGIPTTTYNFSSIASNHAQHIHRLLEFIKAYRFDVVVFYGGYNESFLHYALDPRPGYPFNQFFLGDLDSVSRALLEHSTLAEIFDRKTDAILGLRALWATVRDADQEGWRQQVLERYQRDLLRGQQLSTLLASPNRCQETKSLSFLQPVSLDKKIQKRFFTTDKDIQNVKVLWDMFKAWSNGATKPEWHIDISDLSARLSFVDPVHITQDSRKIVADVMTEHIVARLGDCLKPSSGENG